MTAHPENISAFLKLIFFVFYSHKNRSQSDLVQIWKYQKYA